MSSARLAAKAGLSSSWLKRDLQPETVQNVAVNLAEGSNSEGLGPVCTARLTESRGTYSREQQCWATLTDHLNHSS